MERREFLKLFFMGVGVAVAAAPADAFVSLAPPAEPDRNPDLAPRPALATSEDVDGAQVQKAYYYRPYYRHRRRVYRRYGRRVYRRHARRVYRRYRRRYYY
jgi:hypothetical protein